MTFDDLTERTWSENRLFTVLLELTYRCNLDCFFCYNDLGLHGKPLSFDDYAQLLRDLAAMHVLSVTLSGGEPLAHPDFFRIGALAKELGFLVRVKSNGHALHGTLAKRLREEVDPFIIEVSLHGATPETHDRQTRVPGSFERLVENIGELRESGMLVKVNSTLTAWNESETAGMYALCDELGVPLRFDLQVTPRDDGDRTPLNIAPTPEGIRHLMRVENERFAAAEAVKQPSTAAAPAEFHPPSKHCGAGSSSLAIDPYGNIYPCVQWRRAVGNLHDVRIHEVWDTGFGDIRREAEEVVGVVSAHPRGRLLGFCPGLAEMLTGSATRIPQEMERVAEIVATS